MIVICERDFTYGQSRLFASLLVLLYGPVSSVQLCLILSGPSQVFRRRVYDNLISRKQRVVRSECGVRESALYRGIRRRMVPACRRLKPASCQQ